jgi:hypothetical protein
MIVTPRVMRTLIKSLKPQLSPKVGANQVTEVGNQNSNEMIEHSNSSDYGPDASVQEILAILGS